MFVWSWVQARRAILYWGSCIPDFLWYLPEYSPLSEAVRLQKGILLSQLPSWHVRVELPSKAKSWPVKWFSSHRNSTLLPSGNNVLSRNWKESNDWIIFSLHKFQIYKKNIKWRKPLILLDPFSNDGIVLYLS